MLTLRPADPGSEAKEEGWSQRPRKSREPQGAGLWLPHPQGALVSRAQTLIPDGGEGKPEPGSESEWRLVLGGQGQVTRR